MRVPGLKRLRQLARWVSSRFTGGALILGYHRIAAEADDFYSICVSPERFDEHLQVLLRYTRPLSLENLVDTLRDGTSLERAVVLTFDDGYVDNLHQARPLLEHYGVPATFFLASGYLGSCFWWDELAQTIMYKRQLPRELTVNVGGEFRSWRVPDATINDDSGSGTDNRTSLLQEIYHLLLELPFDAREAEMERLRRQIAVDYDISSDATRAMTADELRQLAASPLVTIGAHTVSHPVLTSLSPAAQKHEIEQSKRDLETLLERPVVAFSYPNGAADDTTRKLIRQTGFSSACASFNNVTHSGSDPFYLPRFWMPDWDGDAFARWLRHWLPGASEPIH